MILPFNMWLEGGSKKKVLLVNIGFLAKAETSVCFYVVNNRYFVSFIMHRDEVLKIFGEFDIVYGD